MGMLNDEDHESARSSLNRRDIFDDNYISFASSKWKTFNEFRKSVDFCDVKIECRDGALHAHKCILSAASPYFKTLFLSPLSSHEHKKTINFKSYALRTVNSILEYIYNYYCYEMEESTNVEELLQLAEFLQLDLLVGELVESIRDSCTVSNCFNWCKVAKSCGVEKAFIVARSFMLLNYGHIIQKYPELEASIKEVLPTDDPVFQKEILLGAGARCHSWSSGLCVINTASNVVEDIQDAYHRYFRRGTNHASFFVYDFSLFAVIVDGLKNHNEGNNYKALKENAAIMLIEYDQINCDFEYHSEDDLKIEVSDLFSRLSDETDYMHTLFATYGWLASVFYDDVESLYIVIYTENRRNSQTGVGSLSAYHIFKINLYGMSLASNWITIQPKSKNIQLVKSGQGTILIDGLHEVYLVEDFDFQSKSNNHSANPLNVSHSSSRRSKRLKLSKETVPDDKVWFSVAHDGQVLLLGAFDDPPRIDVYVLDEKEKRWMSYCFIEIPHLKEINSLFQYQGQVVVSLVVAHDVKDDSEDSEQGKDKVHIELHRFEMKEKTFSKVMNLTQKYAFSVIPEYFLY